MNKPKTTGPATLNEQELRQREGESERDWMARCAPIQGHVWEGDFANSQDYKMFTAGEMWSRFLDLSDNHEEPFACHVREFLADRAVRYANLCGRRAVVARRFQNLAQVYVGALNTPTAQTPRVEVYAKAEIERINAVLDKYSEPNP